MAEINKPKPMPRVIASMGDLETVIEHLIDDYKKEEKPPLGLTPRRVHDHARIKDIVAAMNRYVEADKVIPTEWAEELYDLLLYYEPWQPTIIKTPPKGGNVAQKE